jgi:segregation and condensation protein B
MSDPPCEPDLHAAQAGDPSPAGAAETAAGGQEAIRPKAGEDLPCSDHDDRDEAHDSAPDAAEAGHGGASAGFDASHAASGANGDQLTPRTSFGDEDYGNQPELTTQQVIEAVLFAADTPLPVAKIVSILGVGSARDIKKHIETLNDRYGREGAAFRIENIAGGYQMLTLPAYNTWLRRLKQNRQDSRLSPAALETLAVVAYKQPVVRAEIEAIRGVAAGEMLNRLRELGLVKIVGRAEDVGRPMLYGTTRRFLEVFGLSSLEDLPPVEQLQAPE